tara:strand:+ start:474 stop:803 length:330 start_codon:yes stop_codon:yes gene_type:complete
MVNNETKKQRKETTMNMVTKENQDHLNLEKRKVILDERAKKQKQSLSKITSKVIAKLTNNQLEVLIDKLIRNEIFALVVTRPLFINKIKMVNKYLREVRGINLKEKYSK